jgi:hypothetical protein
MAHIKEPKGVDFIIQSEPLTEETRKEITAFIQAYKSKKSIRKRRSQSVLEKTNRTTQN